MHRSAAIALLLFTPVAAVAQPGEAELDAKAAEFGNHVYAAAMQVSTVRRDADLADLAAGAVRGLYEGAGRPVPAGVLAAVRDAKRHEDRMRLIGAARARLADAAALRGVRAYLAATHGFRHAFDPLSGLATLRGSGTLVSVDMDFGLGFELDGADGPRATAYRVERLIAAGTVPPTGLFGPPPRPEAVASPAAFPWRVRRVVPGGPANRAGLRPGDVITHLNDSEVTAERADALFGRLTDPPELAAGKGAVPRPAQFALRVRRGTDEVRAALTTEDYGPTNVAGCFLRPDGTWDGMLDPVHRIGYVRLGAVELASGSATAAVVADLAGRGCRGLILDLRWCPGGYVEPGTRIAGMFVAANTMLARVELLPNVQGKQTEYRAVPVGARYPDLPLVVLVGAETVGGGELIAAALQDNGRAVVVGQRTAGRAATQEPIDLGYAGLQFKATYGTTLRPNGKSRHRTPTSLPTDDWGIRPDPGLDVPLTPGAAAQVRAWAEEHALRFPGDRTALPFDDPDRDPPRAAALAHLRRLLGPPARPVEN